MPADTRLLTEHDIARFLDGSHTNLASVLGAHHLPAQGATHFAFWAPAAQTVSVIGDFNGWNRTAHPLLHTGGGIWTGIVENTYPGSNYKYHVCASRGEFAVDKLDPFAFAGEAPPSSASLIWDLHRYKWRDHDWMAGRHSVNSLEVPWSIYEVHLGSWRRAPQNRWLSYTQLADQLIPYVKEMGFTHVEFLPVMEHPFYGSWGYQITGYFAPTARYGSPEDFMSLVDRLHQSGIGVILDWVPSHFPKDQHSLALLDGKHEYEPADPRRAEQPEWNSYIFDYSRNQVRSFLASSALFWLREYHVDALRFDGVASMLYLDYARRPGEWLPNRFGGNHNLDAISFLQHLNRAIAQEFPDVQTIAEESTAFPHVTGAAHPSGLNFSMKWDMGWMHDTLQYLAEDPVRRKYHHGTIAFRADYAATEKFVLPLSHDEVVHGKRSLLGKMPGADLERFANLRLLLSYMYAQPGKKLLFMGGEFAVWHEWNHDSELDWSLLSHKLHSGVRLLIGDLNHLYQSEAALHSGEYKPTTFEWIERNDSERNVLAFFRRSPDDERVLVVCNFSGVRQDNYRLGVPTRESWREIFNSNAVPYGGNGHGNWGALKAIPIPLHGLQYSITASIPPLTAVFLKPSGLSTPDSK